jgi:hypothetical protein
MTRPAAASTTRRHGLGVLLIAAAVVAGPAAPAAAQDAPLNASRVRAADRKAASLLTTGIANSATVARLVEVIEQSDLCVYVETALLRELGLRGMCGTMRIVAATPRGRYIRISINVPDGDANLIGALAHELQHAAEIASHPEVRNADDLCRFYRGAGFQKPNGTYCTKDAVRVTELVLTEVARAFAARGAERQ